MSLWRKKALEFLPEYREIIQSSEGPGMLWIKLTTEFSLEYEKKMLHDDLIRRFYGYALWCLNMPGQSKYLSDTGSAAFHFFENVASDTNASKDLHRWISREEFHRLTDAFRYPLSEAEYDRFAANFLSKAKS